MIDIMYSVSALFYPLVSGVLGMLLAQLIKLITTAVKCRTLNFKILTSAGGMPSSHSCMVSALACSIGIQDGWTSTGFALAVIFSMIVLYDAAGVRYAAGKQAYILNQIQEIIEEREKMTVLKLKESLGHTKFEIVIGVLMGIGLSLTLNYLIVNGI